jgi:hypothetical protein
MHLRFHFVALAALFCAPGILSAGTTYNLNGNFGSTASTGYSIYPTASPVADWTENYVNTGEQIDCVLALAQTTHVCGNPGPGNAVNINIPAAPGGSLPGGVVNYLLVDGDPRYGGPVSTNLTGMTIGLLYQVSFYQASSEETPIDTASNDKWEVFLINGSNNGTSTPTNAVFTSSTMVNTGGISTPWEVQTFTFVATAANETLEFLANASAPTVPPLFGLADVQVTNATPEPGTCALTLLGAGALCAIAARKRSRNVANRP